MKTRIKRLEGQLTQEKQKTIRLERSLRRSHRNLEELRSMLWGDKQALNEAERLFKNKQDELIKGLW